MGFEQYRNAFSSVRMERRDGILLAQLHTNGRSLVYEERLHHELGPAFRAIADDRENRVVILTGMGDEFCSRINMGSLQALLSKPEGWDRVIFVARQMLNALLDIDVPIIAAVNGPVLLHTELPLMADIVIAADTAVFADLVHAPNGIVPGDGVHVLWPMLLGINRARYFLLTGQRLAADEALRLGLVAEVVAPDQLLPRAWELAEQLNEKPHVMLHQTRGVLRLELERVMREHLERGFAREALAALGARESGSEELGVAALPIEGQMVENYVTGELTPRVEYR